MAVFSVDSEAVLNATTQVQNTADRIRAENQSMRVQLTQLQQNWSGSAALAFQEVSEKWSVAQRQMEDALSNISVALGNAGRQYADTEQQAASLFR